MVVTMMVAIEMMVDAVMPAMMMTMMLRHRSRISARGTEDRHGEGQGQSQPERREEWLLHDFVSLHGRSEIHRTNR